MAFPVIKFNDASGSDTAASGAGPATALTGAAASYSGSVFTLDGSPDLSSVATDGSHCIYVVTSTGRRFFKITAVNDGADTVTVESAPAGTTTGLTWAIGGKRKTLDAASSRFLMDDTKWGWIAELEDDQSLTSALTLTNPLTIRSNNSTKRVITQTAVAPNFTATATNGNLRLKAIKLQNSNATKNSNTLGVSGKVSADNCIFGDVTNALYAGIFNPSCTLRNCEIAFCTNYGISGTSSVMLLSGCNIHDNAGGGIFVNSATLALFSSTVESNTGYGIRARPTDTIIIIGSTIHGNTSDGIAFNVVGAGRCLPLMINNNITGNGAYGLLFSSGQDVLFVGSIDNNNCGTSGTANTSGSVNDTTLLGDNNINVDPQYNNAASGDFTPTGDNTAQLGFPMGAFGQSATESYMDIGTQREPSSGGGVSMINRRTNSLTLR